MHTAVPSIDNHTTQHALRIERQHCRVLNLRTEERFELLPLKPSGYFLQCALDDEESSFLSPCSSAFLQWQLKSAAVAASGDGDARQFVGTVVGKDRDPYPLLHFQHGSLLAVEETSRTLAMYRDDKLQSLLATDVINACFESDGKRAMSISSELQCKLIDIERGVALTETSLALRGDEFDKYSRSELTRTFSNALCPGASSSLVAAIHSKHFRLADLRAKQPAVLIATMPGEQQRWPGSRLVLTERRAMLGLYDEEKSAEILLLDLRRLSTSSNSSQQLSRRSAWQTIAAPDAKTVYRTLCSGSKIFSEGTPFYIRTSAADMPYGADQSLSPRSKAATIAAHLQFEL